MSNIDSRIEASNQRAKRLTELIEKELSRDWFDASKLNKLYLASITLLNGYYSGIINSEFNKSIHEVFHLPLDDSEFIKATSAEYNKLSDNVAKLETIIYSNIDYIVDFYVNRDLTDQDSKIKR